MSKTTFQAAMDRFLALSSDEMLVELSLISHEVWQCLTLMLARELREQVAINRAWAAKWESAMELNRQATADQCAALNRQSLEYRAYEKKLLEQITDLQQRLLTQSAENRAREDAHLMENARLRRGRDCVNRSFSKVLGEDIFNQQFEKWLPNLISAYWDNHGAWWQYRNSQTDCEWVNCPTDEIPKICDYTDYRVVI